ncbi:MAG: rubrerythrin, partial [Methylibium sp.]|nr:rubrerythrin [Methylibium sp.]
MRSDSSTVHAHWARKLGGVNSHPHDKEIDMQLKGSKTEQNLKDAFAGESQANRRYLYFANKADI